MIIYFIYKHSGYSKIYSIDIISIKMYSCIIYPFIRCILIYSMASSSGKKEPTQLSPVKKRVKEGTPPSRHRHHHHDHTWVMSFICVLPVCIYIELCSSYHRPLTILHRLLWQSNTLWPVRNKIKFTYNNIIHILCCNQKKKIGECEGGSTQTVENVAA